MDGSLRALVCLWLFKKTKRVIFWEWFIKLPIKDGMKAMDTLKDPQRPTWIHDTLGL